MRPCRIRSSAARREAMPAWERSLLRRTRDMLGKFEVGSVKFEAWWAPSAPSIQNDAGKAGHRRSNFELLTSNFLVHRLRRRRWLAARLGLKRQSRLRRRLTHRGG